MRRMRTEGGRDESLDDFYEIGVVEADEKGER
jgi:hypothetical protein